MVFTFQYGRRSLKKEKMKMHFKKGFSKQVSFKASQSSTSYLLLKTGINVLCREKYTLVGSFAVCPSALAGEPSMAKHWAARERELFLLELGHFLLTQLQSYSLLFFSLLSWCYCFYLLLKNYSLIIFQSACLLFYFFSISAV